MPSILPDKLNKVFSSCESKGQLDTAIKYASLVLEILRRDETVPTEYLVKFVIVLERLIGYTEGRLSVDIQKYTS